MPRLTSLADHSKLWVGPAAVLTLTGSPRARRAAGRGITTLAATGLIANQVAKRLNRRPRPSLLRVPLARIAGRIPTSTSFPSGHAASAAAFASAVAPYPFGNGHPRFHGWVNPPPHVLGVLASALAAAMNPSVANTPMPARISNDEFAKATTRPEPVRSVLRLRYDE